MLFSKAHGDGQGCFGCLMFILFFIAIFAVSYFLTEGLIWLVPFFGSYFKITYTAMTIFVIFMIDELGLDR